MRPPISRLTLIKTGLLLGIWTAYGVLCAWQAHYWYAFSKTPMSWWDALRYEVTFAWLWCAVTPIVVWFARRYRFERQTWRRHLFIHLAVMLLFVLPATKLAFDAIAMPPNSAFRGVTWEKLFRSVESTLDTGPLLYAVVLLIEHAIIYYQRYQSVLVRASQLQTQLIQAQLQALRMQLHPHFLFNTLHAITALVHEDPERAERTIARLGELLRLFLASSSIHEVPLGEELRTLDLYLEIERARFEDRLRVHYDVPPGLHEATVPNLVLQPLVENAIRHGIGKRADAGWISISAERYGDTLVIRVTDNGAGFSEDLTGRERQGLGLANTRGRLESLYGPHQSLALRNLPSGGVEARITMPFRTQAATSHDITEDHVELQSNNR